MTAAREFGHPAASPSLTDLVSARMGSLTEVQRQSITLAYYSGYTYRQVSALVGVTLAAVKSRIRDGLLRMRDCLGVS